MLMTLSSYWHFTLRLSYTNGKKNDREKEIKSITKKKAIISDESEFLYM